MGAYETQHGALFTTPANFLLPYIRNVKFGVEFNQAFKESFAPSYGGVGSTPDDAAIHWMLTDNFRQGREMDHTATTKNEFNYQERGFAKYADIYRIFGWQPIRDFHRQENVN